MYFFQYVVVVNNEYGDGMKTLLEAIKSLFLWSDEDLLKDYQKKADMVNELTRYRVSSNVVSLKE